MKTYKFLLILSLLLLGNVSLDAKKTVKSSEILLEFPTSANESRRYGNLDYGLRIQVRSDVSDRGLINTSDLPSKEASSFPTVVIEEPLRQCVEQYLYSAASGLGFKTGRDPESDFILRVTIKDYRLRVRDYNVKKRIYSSSAAMVVEWELLTANMESVIAPRTSTGHGNARSQAEITSPLRQAYTEALGNIDWDAIASQLKVAKTARQEKNKEVGGMGNTALEHTVIRWYIISTPQGADVSWRVVSSTPDVANTNANFVGNTPYESTEAFDIRGLSYQNSGNVQIEVTCEKKGYITQKKRFNLRQAIDQKEISSKFNLVKEDAEE